jgi:hypothetical protein
MLIYKMQQIKSIHMIYIYMETFSSLFKKEHTYELFLVVLLIIYLIMGFKTPESVATVVDTLIGKVFIFIVVVFIFMNYHPILAVLSLFVSFDLIRRSSMTTGLDALQKYVPTEEKKNSQFTAFNQFPYTLEQEHLLGNQVLLLLKQLINHYLMIYIKLLR